MGEGVLTIIIVSIAHICSHYVLASELRVWYKNKGLVLLIDTREIR